MTLKEIVGHEEMQVILTRGQEQGFLGIDGLLLGVALGAVFIILVIVYRSPLLPILVLLTLLPGMASAAPPAAVWFGFDRVCYIAPTRRGPPKGEDIDASTTHSVRWFRCQD